MSDSAYACKSEDAVQAYHKQWALKGVWSYSTPEPSWWSDQDARAAWNRFYKRAEVWMIADYYDPVSLLEIKR